MQSSGRLRSVTLRKPDVDVITLSSDEDDDCPSSSKRSRVPSPCNIVINDQFSLAEARVKQEKESSPVSVQVSTKSSEKEIPEVSRHRPMPPTPPPQKTPPPQQPLPQRTSPLQPPPPRHTPPPQQPQQPPQQRTSPLQPPRPRPPPEDQIQFPLPLRRTPPNPPPPRHLPPSFPPPQPQPPPPKEPSISTSTSTSGSSKTIIATATVTPPVVSPPRPQPAEDPNIFSSMGDQFIKNIRSMTQEKSKLEKVVKEEKQKREEACKELGAANAEIERLRSLIMHGDTRSGQRESEVAQLRTQINKLKEEDNYSKAKLSSVSDTIKFLQRQMIEILKEAEMETGEGDPAIQNFIHVQTSTTTSESRQLSVGTGAVSMNEERCLNQIDQMEKSFAQQFKELSAQDDALKSEVAATHALLGELQGLLGIGGYPDSVSSSPAGSPKLSNENGDIIEME